LTEKITIHAVHERDAEKMWNKLELKETEPCFVCGQDVTHKSFAALGVHNKEIVVCCENGGCFYEFGRKVRNRK